MSAISELDSVRPIRPLSEDICGFSRPRDPYKIDNSIYLRQSSREETFKDWPQQLNQSPEELAQAGFIYERVSDVVKCVSCKVNIEGWLPEDDPWVEHAKCNSSCEYLTYHKGEAYIRELTERLLHSPVENKVCTPTVHLDAPVGVCKVCCEEKSNVMFVPCGHLVTCSSCAPKVKKCFHCSHRIDKYQRVYL